MSAKVKTEASSPKQMNEKAEENELTERLELDFVEESAGDDWDGNAIMECDDALATADEAEEEGPLKPSPDSPRSLSAPRSPEDEVETIDEDTVVVMTDEAVVLHTGEEDEMAEGDVVEAEAPSVRPKGGGGPKTPPESDLGATAEHKGGSSHDVSQESSMREPSAKRRRRRRRSSSRSSSSTSFEAHSRKGVNGGDKTRAEEVFEQDEVEEDRHSAVSRGRDKSLTDSSSHHHRRRHRHRSKSPPKSYKLSDRRNRSPHEKRTTARGVKREHYSDEHEEDEENGEEMVEDEMDYEEDDEERIRRNKRARLVRLREARSRQIGHEYIPPLSSRRTSAFGGRFAPQPYFKNPSYYPRDKELSSSSARSVAVPVPLARVEPMPGGRLPLVQRRSSPPPPSLVQRRRGPSPQAPPPPLLTKKRRYIVEEISHVPRRSRTPPPPLLSTYRSSNGSSSSRSSRLRSLAELGPQTLYPSRRDPYPAPRSYESASSRHASGSSSSSRYYGGSSLERDPYIHTGNRLIPKPFVPPPPPGKKWNCPRREESYVPSERRLKWRCPKREPATPPPRR
ncbi:hypothetical protein niasHT_020541 [Heterodera trifolii]|uniref:Uncharacterized protein n=1 Tax=Heterodera trifolii TaxID=157864 RepID=A0ABD2J9X1_9BILA